MTRFRRRMAGAAVAAGAVLCAGAMAQSAAAPTLPEETGTIHTVAGTGLFFGDQITYRAPLGDGGPAGVAPLDFPTGVAATPDGGFLVSDQYASRIRRVSPAGVITTVAGTGRAGLSGDGGPATAARINYPSGVAVLADGAIAIADQRNNRVRLVDAGGTITTLVEARWPDGVAAAADGGVLVVERLNNRVLHVSRSGVVTVVAGDGVRGFAGDGGPAVAARLARPVGVASAPDGAFLIADGSNRVRRVGADGVITTVAGDGSARARGDGGPATSAGVPRPTGVAATPDGGLLIASVNQVRRVRPDGVIVTVAGTGRGNISGDAGPAQDATLWKPGGVAAAAGGGFLIADTFSNRIRFVAAALPAATGSPPPRRLLAISFRRPIQRGGAGLVTRIRVACPPRPVALRFTVSERADVTLRMTRGGRQVSLRRARLAPGPHVWRVQVAAIGEHRLRITARAGGRIAADQAQISVNRCSSARSRAIPVG